MTGRIEHTRVLGIVASSRGIGFAVMEGKNTLVDWGAKMLTGDKNAASLSNITKLIRQYRPDAIALENTRPNRSERGERVQALAYEIAALARSYNITVARFTRKQLNRALIPDKRGTKYAVAEYLAARYPQELGLRLPRKRRNYDNEDPRMDLFDAVALAEHFLRTRR